MILYENANKIAARFCRTANYCKDLGEACYFWFGWSFL